jgi:hypothetical protein
MTDKKRKTVKVATAEESRILRRLKESNAKLDNFIIALKGIRKICDTLLNEDDNGKLKGTNDKHTTEHKSNNCEVCD